MFLYSEKKSFILTSPSFEYNFPYSKHFSLGLKLSLTSNVEGETKTWENWELLVSTNFCIICQSWIMRDCFLLSYIFIYRCFLVWPMHLWLFSCWVIHFSLSLKYIYLHCWAKTGEWMCIRKCTRFPNITCIDLWFHYNLSWLVISNLLFSSAKWAFLFLFPWLSCLHLHSVLR